MWGSVFVGQCDVSTTSSHVKSHLGALDVVCLDIYEMRNRNHVSYKVSIPGNKREIVLDPSNWPDGFVVRAWTETIRKRQPFRNNQLRPRNSTKSRQERLTQGFWKLSEGRWDANGSDAHGPRENRRPRDRNGYRKSYECPGRELYESRGDCDSYYRT